MDWIKIKLEHMSPTYTYYEVGLLVKYQILVAQLKRQPTDDEIAHELPLKRLQMLGKKVERLYQIDLKTVAKRVLVDVESIENRKQLGKARQEKYRAKLRKSRITQTIGDEADKRREDKIREDKTQYGDSKNILLTKKEYETLTELIGENNVIALIEELSDYIASTGKSYKSHYATIRSWARRKSKEGGIKKKGKGIV